MNTPYIECVGDPFWGAPFRSTGVPPGSQFGLDSVTVPDGVLGLGWTGLGTLCSLADFCGKRASGCLGDINKPGYIGDERLTINQDPRKTIIIPDNT